MAGNNSWKEHLLKSGIPLEFEIKRFLDSKGCVSNFEYTYLRANEAEIPTEFSYDISSTYILKHHFIDLMIECKYRHESTKWVFLPEEYGGPDEIGHTSFMHKNSHFNRNAGYSRFISEHPLQFAPLCSKGIELNTDGPNPKTITQAINQLSYAMAERIVDGMHHQTDIVLSEHFGGTDFYNIPIIVTTAKLYRIKEGADIDTIKATEKIEEVSEIASYLVVKSKPGIALETYNNRIFKSFIDEHGKENLEKRLHSFNKDLEFVMTVIAKEYCPSSIVVIHYSKERNGFEDFFNYIDNVLYPNEETVALMEKRTDELQSMINKFKSKKSFDK